jgi:hypothetical protein
MNTGANDAPAYSSFWNLDGELLTESESKALQDEINVPMFQSNSDKYSTPLLIIFEFEDQLPAGTGGVRVTVEFSDGTSSLLGTSVNRRAGQKTKDRVFAVSLAVVSIERRTFEWPNSIALNLKYPAETPTLVKTIGEIPDEPVRLARGVSWSVEAETGYEPGGDGTRYPAGVLEVSKESLDLLSFDVRVYKKGVDRPLRGSYTTIRERDDQQFEIRVSERFPTNEELDRIEIYRQRYQRTTVFDVPLYIDLLRQANSEE